MRFRIIVAPSLLFFSGFFTMDFVLSGRIRGRAPAVLPGINLDAGYPLH